VIRKNLLKILYLSIFRHNQEVSIYLHFLFIFQDNGVSPSCDAKSGRALDLHETDKMLADEG
jgi:hypothetical protein